MGGSSSTMDISKIEKKTRFPDSATREAQVTDSTSSSQRFGGMKL